MAVLRTADDFVVNVPIAGHRVEVPPFIAGAIGNRSEKASLPALARRPAFNLVLVDDDAMLLLPFLQLSFYLELMGLKPFGFLEKLLDPAKVMLSAQVALESAMRAASSRVGEVLLVSPKARSDVSARFVSLNLKLLLLRVLFLGSPSFGLVAPTRSL